jgi:hypothetical protein
MSRQTYTFKINEEKIRDTLCSALQNEEDFLPSFSEYLVNEEKTFKSNSHDVSDIMRYDYVVECFRNVEFPPKVEHLAAAFDWIWEVYDLSYNDVQEDVWDKYGFELIYDVGAKDRCWVYLNQMYKFSVHADMEDEITHYEAHYLYTNKVYKYSTSYLITLLSLLCLENSQDVEHWKNYDVEEIKGFKKNTETPFYVNIAEKELIYIRENNEIAKKKQEEGGSTGKGYRRDPDESHHGVAEHLLYEMLDIRKQIMNYDGWIFIHDSY